MRLLIVVSLLAVVSCAHQLPPSSPRPRSDLVVPGSGGGVSLVRDWTVDLTEAQPAPGGITRAQADARYLKLTGGTLSGALASSVASGSTAISIGSGAYICFGGLACISYQPGTNTFTISGGPTVSMAGGLSVAGNVTSNAAGPTVAFATSSTAVHTQAAGVAFASFPACASGTRGSRQYDTTNKVWRDCANGAADAADLWRTPAMSSGNGFQQNTFLGCFRSGDVVVTEAVDLMGMGVTGATTDNVQVLSGSAATISCSWETTGVVGGAATGVVMELTNGTETCNCTLDDGSGGPGTCDTTVRTNVSCDCTWSGTAGARIAALTAGNKGIKLQMKNTTDCGTNPRNVQCTAYTNMGPL